MGGIWPGQIAVGEWSHGLRRGDLEELSFTALALAFSWRSANREGAIGHFLLLRLTTVYRDCTFSLWYMWVWRSCER